MEEKPLSLNSLSAGLQLEAEMNVKESIANKNNLLIQRVLLFIILISFIIAVFFNGHLNEIMFTIVSVIFFGLIILIFFFAPLKIFKAAGVKDSVELRMKIAAEYVTIITERIKSIPGEMAEREKNILNIQANLSAYQEECAADRSEEIKEREILRKNLFLLKEIIRSI
ncbi:MAG: hypothetical protein WC467_00800 [Patescibacteria group bacterium]